MDKILRPKQVCEKLGIGMSTLYDWMKQPDFPPKIRLGKQAVGFRESDIEEWIDSRTQTKSELESVQ